MRGRASIAVAAANDSFGPLRSGATVGTDVETLRYIETAALAGIGHEASRRKELRNLRTIARRQAPKQKLIIPAMSRQSAKHPFEKASSARRQGCAKR